MPVVAISVLLQHSLGCVGSPRDAGTQHSWDAAHVDRLEYPHPWESMWALRTACTNHTAGLDFTFIITQRFTSLIVNALAIY